MPGSSWEDDEQDDDQQRGRGGDSDQPELGFEDLVLKSTLWPGDDQLWEKHLDSDELTIEVTILDEEEAELITWTFDEAVIASYQPAALESAEGGGFATEVAKVTFESVERTDH